MVVLNQMSRIVASGVLLVIGYSLFVIRGSGITQAAPYYDCYDTYAELTQKIQQWDQQNPNLIEITDIGDSWEKQQGTADRDLWVVRVTNEASAQTKFPVFYVGEHHARELASSQVLIDFIEQELLAKYGSDPTITSLLDTREIYLMPMANPDGHVQAEAGQNWRKNTNSSNGACNSAPPNNVGTDLNRNYSKGWGGTGSSGQHCSATYRGPSAFSEVETQAIRDFIDRIQPQIVLSYHTFSNLIIYPWGHSTQPPQHQAQFDRLARRLSELTATTSSPSTYRYGQVSRILYQASGDTIDWFYDKHQLPGFTFEMGTTFWPTCQSYQTIYEKNVKPMIFAAQVANDPWAPPVSATPTARQSPAPTMPTPTSPRRSPPPASPTGGGGPRADVNEDGRVDDADVKILLPNWNLPAPFLFPKADVNGDGLINALDLSHIFNSWSR